MVYTLELLPTNVYDNEKKLPSIYRIVHSLKLDCSYCNRNINSGITWFLCGNLGQLGAIKNSVLVLYLCKWKRVAYFHTMVVTSSIFSPTFCSNLFSSLQFWKVIVACSAVFGKGTFTSMLTWENFELTQWISLNYFAYIFALHQTKNY